VPDVGVSDEVLDEFEGGRVQPLQIVEEQGEWMLLAGKHAQERTERRMKAPLLFLRWEFRNCCCSPMSHRSSGIKFTMSCPFKSRASRKALRQRSASSSLLLRI